MVFSLSAGSPPLSRRPRRACPCRSAVDRAGPRLRLRSGRRSSHATLHRHSSKNSSRPAYRRRGFATTRAFEPVHDRGHLRTLDGRDADPHRSTDESSPRPGRGLDRLRRRGAARGLSANPLGVVVEVALAIEEAPRVLRRDVGPWLSDRVGSHTGVPSDVYRSCLVGAITIWRMHMDCGCW